MSLAAANPFATVAAAQPHITLAPPSPFVRRAPQITSDFNSGDEDGGAANSSADNYTPTEDFDDSTDSDIIEGPISGNGIVSENFPGPSGTVIPGSTFATTVVGPGLVTGSSGANDVTVNDGTTINSSFATTIIGSATIATQTTSGSAPSTSVSGSAAPKSAAGKSVQVGVSVKQILGASFAIAACALYL